MKHKKDMSTFFPQLEAKKHKCLVYSAMCFLIS